MSNAQSNRRNLTCVLRNLGYGTGPQYVPVSESGGRKRGEKTFTGLFASQVERHGPSGSHSRTVCTPVGELVENK